MAADAPADIVDEARASAAGSRKAAAWLASVLGALPGIALITTLVQKPDDQDWDLLLLVIGVGLVALGGALGLIAFARVFTPVPLTTKALSGYDISGIPGSRWDTFDKLSVSLEVARRAFGKSEANKQVADAASASADVLAARARAEAELAAKQAGDDAAKERAKKLQVTADDLARKGWVRAAAKAVAAAEHEANTLQFTRNVAIRKEAFLLKAGDIVRSRFRDALRATPLAVGLAAIGLIVLAVAPEDAETEETPAAVTLVRLTLNDSGRRSAGCPPRVRSIRALRIGGTEEAPRVVTFPTAECGLARLLVFKKTEDPALGSVAEVRPTGAPAGG